MIKIIKNLSWADQFLLGMVLIYAIASLFNFSYVFEAFAEAINNFIKLIPLFVLVYAVIFVLNIFLKPENIQKHLGRESGMKGFLYALAGSILVASPPYVALPMLKELRKHGMKYSLVAVYMNNRHVSPAMIPVMIYYFGLPFTIIISVYILIFAVITGAVIGKILD